jgi:N-acetylglucosaminyldiphosphoundecaprenol N-acetyl-beta-D-mannosaminyltransferase
MLVSIMNSKKIFGLRFSCLSQDQLVEKLINEPPAGSDAQMLFTTNLDHVVRLRSNAAFRQAYSKAAHITVDGFPVYLYAKWRGLKVPGRVTGADLLPALVEKMSPATHKLFFVVSDNETALKIKGKLELLGFHDVKTAVPDFGFELDDEISIEIARQIASHGTTHLFFCVGCPKSEIWLGKYQQRLGPCYAMAFGSGANFFAGTVARAPKIVRKLGGEWLWRFFKEPRRLFNRYFVESWKFLLAIVEDINSSKSPLQYKGIQEQDAL